MRLQLLVFCTLLLSVNSFARLLSAQNPLDGVLDADLVVIVSRSPVDKTGKLFRVMETFWGDAAPGDSIDLGNFKLRISRNYEDDIIEPITEETSILLFLHHPEDSPKQWEPTYFGESYFWVQTRLHYPQLRVIAQHAVLLRRQWEQAARIPDSEQRIAALWPFLSSFEYGVNIFSQTEKQLGKSAPPELFFMPFSEDSDYPRPRDYLTQQWHDKVRKQIQEQHRAYRELVAASTKDSSDADKEKRRATESELVRAISSGIYELKADQDPDDLPVIRDLALLAAQYHQDRIAYAALNAFYSWPHTKANLPAIEALINAFRPDYKPGTWKSVVWKAEQLACEYRYVETVPLLAPFVEDEFTGKGARFCLQGIVGADLGHDPKAWMDWYQSESETPRSPQ